MQIEITYTEKELKELIIKDIEEKLNLDTFNKDCLSIMVKSKQNYKSEWEEAAFKANYSYFKA